MVSLDGRAPKRGCVSPGSGEASIIERYRREQRQRVAMSSCRSSRRPLVCGAGVVVIVAFKHVAVARVDRACDAYAARAVRARETVSDGALRFCVRVAVWFSRAR